MGKEKSNESIMQEASAEVLKYAYEKALEILQAARSSVVMTPQQKQRVAEIHEGIMSDNMLNVNPKPRQTTVEMLGTIMEAMFLDRGFVTEAFGGKVEIERGNTYLDLADGVDAVWNFSGDGQHESSMLFDFTFAGSDVVLERKLRASKSRFFDVPRMVGEVQSGRRNTRDYMRVVSGFDESKLRKVMLPWAKDDYRAVLDSGVHLLILGQMRNQLERQKLFADTTLRLQYQDNQSVLSFIRQFRKRADLTIARLEKLDSSVPKTKKINDYVTSQIKSWTGVVY